LGKAKPPAKGCSAPTDLKAPTQGPVGASTDREGWDQWVPALTGRAVLHLQASGFSSVRELHSVIWQGK